MMNLELGDRWATALESGAYDQCHGTLKTDKGYCCLGVAAMELQNELIHETGCKMVISGNDPDTNRRMTLYTSNSDGYSGTLPRAAREVLGLEGEDCSHLVNLNDVYKMNFDQIAQVIRNVFMVDYDAVEDGEPANDNPENPGDIAA